VKSKGRFFLQNESIRTTNRIDSNRELECSTVQVVNKASEAVYCAADAAARLKQHKSFAAKSYQLIYRLDDVCTVVYFLPCRNEKNL